MVFIIRDTNFLYWDVELDELFKVILMKFGLNVIYMQVICDNNFFNKKVGI